MSNTARDTRTNARVRVPWSTDLATAGAVVTCAMVMWLFAVGLGTVDLVVVNDGKVRHISGLAVALAAGGAALLGIATVRVLERITPRALRIWTVVAVAATALSAVAPLSAREAAATGTLLGLHAVVATVVIVGVRGSRHSRRHACDPAPPPPHRGHPGSGKPGEQAGQAR